MALETNTAEASGYLVTQDEVQHLLAHGSGSGDGVSGAVVKVAAGAGLAQDSTGAVI